MGGVPRKFSIQSPTLAVAATLNYLGHRRRCCAAARDVIPINLLRRWREPIIGRGADPEIRNRDGVAPVFLVP